MAVNNTSLRWLMQEGSMSCIRLWSWLKVIYESAVKLDPLRRLYREKIWSLRLKAGGLLLEYIYNFQGLAILRQEIYKNVEPEDDIGTDMVEHIEDPLFSGPFYSINILDKVKRSFCDTTVTLRSHKIIKMAYHTKRAIYE